ncbi:hypothetical protein L7F22_020757 [Adiantum nelumboides]|nr:hypothetical protein [Adiantum nelumboides]
MGTGRASRRKEKPVRHRSRTLDGHYKKNGGLDLKIACLIFKEKKHDDPDVHIQAFEQYAELKHIMEEEWGEYFPHTLKEAAKKWYLPLSSFQITSIHKKLKKAFILKYTDDRGDEDILCELDRIKQGKLSVRKYVQKIKELAKRLNESPSEKQMRAWFPSGFNSRKLREQEVPAPTKKFIELIHRALKLEQQSKKEKSRHRGRSDTNNNETFEIEQSNSSSSESSEDDRKKKKKAQRLEPDEPVVTEVKQPERVLVRAIARSFGVIIEELPVDESVSSKLNPKAKEWEQHRSTWKEKGKAKQFDEGKEQREVAAKITKNLSKRKPKIPKCSEARTIQNNLSSSLLIAFVDVFTSS